MIRGGEDACAVAGAIVVGGHTVRDSEIKFGYAVTGIIHPQRILTNASARPGDKLVLTKPLGTGFVTTAHKADDCPEDLFQAACASMVQLNDIAKDAMLEAGLATRPRTSPASAWPDMLMKWPAAARRRSESS